MLVRVKRLAPNTSRQGQGRCSLKVAVTGVRPERCDCSRERSALFNSGRASDARRSTMATSSFCRNQYTHVNEAACCLLLSGVLGSVLHGYNRTEICARLALCAAHDEDVFTTQGCIEDLSVETSLAQIEASGGNMLPCTDNSLGGPPSLCGNFSCAQHERPDCTECRKHVFEFRVEHCMMSVLTH